MKVQTAKGALWFAMVAMSATSVAAAQSTAPADGSPLVTQAELRLPDAPSAIAERQSAEQEPPPAQPVQQPSPSPMQLAERSPRPSPEYPVGPTFWVANGVLFGSTIANAEFIARCRPGSCQSVPDAIRTRGALYAIGISATAGITYICYRFKRSGTKMWIAPVVAATAGNIAYAAHASQYSH